MSDPHAVAEGQPSRVSPSTPKSKTARKNRADAAEVAERLRALASSQPSGTRRMRLDRRWPRVGQEVTLESPPIADQAGGTVACEVVAVSPPFAVLLVCGRQGMVLASSTPVVVGLTGERGDSSVEGLVVDTWTSGHIKVQLSPTEQRRHRRSRLGLSVELRRPGQPAPSVLHCSSVDVAAGGLRVRAPEPLVGGERLFAAITLLEREPVLAIVHVVREPTAIGDGWFEVGLRFSTISDDHRGRLVVFLSQQPSQLKQSDPASQVDRLQHRLWGSEGSTPPPGTSRD